MSFLLGKAEDEQFVFIMQLIKNIAVLIHPEFRNSTESLSGFLGLMNGGETRVYDDPVVKALLWHIGCLTDDPRDFRQRMSSMARPSLGEMWTSHKSVGVGGSNVLGAARERGVEGLAHLTDRVCKVPLNEIVDITKRGLNFIPSTLDVNLYSVSFKASILVPNIKEPEAIQFMDSNKLDALVSFSPEAISQNIHGAIDFFLESLSGEHSNERAIRQRQSAILTEAVILSNEDVLCSIPIIHAGQDLAKDIDSYSLEYRKALNTKGSSAYQIDFDNLKIAEGDSEIFLQLAKHFPRRAARKLRGAALEDSLGL
jgi:hypothetical protein